MKKVPFVTKEKVEEIASKYDGSCQWIDGGDVFESVVMVEVG